MDFMTRNFHIQTFGCQMNANDSDWLARSLKTRGFTESGFDEADIYILNTCSVRDKPEQKVYSELGRIARMCKVRGRRNVTVCVGGCVAQQAGAPLIRRFPQVRLLFGTDGIAHAPEAISRLVEEPGLRLSLLDFVDHYEERPMVWPELPPASRAEKDPGPRPDRVPPAAFVTIMQGCDNYCTYCIVPFVRGRQKSRRAEAILNECRFLLDNGAREITLLGQNVNSYGLDGGANDERTRGKDTPAFADLLYSTAKLPGLERLRFVTPHPKDIAPEVIAAFADMRALCPRLHLPLQSGSDRILKAMNRRYDTARYLEIAQALKQARPDIILTTDIIVGFPGESEEDFQATMDMMREVGFAASFSFVYSDRPGARAALLPGKVERGLALERLSRLQEWQNQANDKVLASMKGKIVEVLIEGRSRLPALLDEPSDPSSSTTGETIPSWGNPSGGSAAHAGPETRPGGNWHDRTDAPMAENGESWQGKTPHGYIVNVTLASRPEGNYRAGGWEGAIVPVRIEAAARHSLKGKQAGAPW